MRQSRPGYSWNTGRSHARQTHCWRPGGTLSCGYCIRLLPLLPPACQVVRIPQRQTDAQLRALLEPYQDAQLLHLSTTEGVFGRFEDREQGQRFQVGEVGATTSLFFEAVRQYLIQ